MGRATSLKKARQQAALKPAVRAEHPAPGWWIPVIAIALILAAYSNSIRGNFVYDDQKQIVENRYIQDGRYFWKAISSDVWAFKGEKREAWSNYWRPVFVLWLMLNYRLFGLNPAGWHALNLLLHVGVCLLLWQLLRRLRAPDAIQAGIVWLFAVHPVHVESVTWISGSTDLLLALFLSGSLLAYLSGRQEASRWKWIAPALYLLALLSKEVAVVFPAVLFVCCLACFGDSISRALRECLIFLAVAAVFLVARSMVLHTAGRATPWAPGYATTLMTVPLLIAHYLRLAFFPVALGPSYGIRAVSQAGFLNFVLPAAVLVLFAVLAAHIMRGERRAMAGVGLAMLILLSPALYIRVFLPDQIAHDRYLYIPLFGLLLLFLPLLHDRLGRGRAFTAAALLLCLPLGALTFQYNRAYQTDLALWRRAVRTDPGSPSAWAMLGSLLRRDGNAGEAKSALGQALKIDPENTQANYESAMIQVSEGKLIEAEAGFRRIIRVFPDHESATDQLSQIYNRENRLEELIGLLQDARKAMPYRRVKYTENLAFAYYRSGQIDRAIQELESVRAELANETDASNLEGWYYLADLYRVKGRNQEAIAAARNYLDAAAVNARLRLPAEQLIQSLGGSRH